MKMVKEEPIRKKTKNSTTISRGHRTYVPEILRTQVSPQFCFTIITITGLLQQDCLSLIFIAFRNNFRKTNLETGTHHY